MFPENIGRYEIKSELGRGGMAVVYLARDPYMKRDVAIKVLPRQFTFDPTFRARFELEAQTIAALEHPAIVSIHDYGEDDEQPFIVMRYMPGGSLADKLEQGSLTVEEAAKILERLGGALDEAHAEGIIHRDLKPGNILFDKNSAAYLADFGIVKLTEASAAFTGSAIIGTTAYMSPEQARGKGELDGRSDIYALGTILYEMLTGELPYEADTPMGQAMMHIIEPVPRILEVKPDLQQSVGDVISKSMAKDPEERYPTASALATALRNVAKIAVIPETVQLPEQREAEPAIPETVALPPEPDPEPSAEEPAAEALATEHLKEGVSAASAKPRLPTLSQNWYPTGLLLIK